MQFARRKSVRLMWLRINASDFGLQSNARILESRLKASKRCISWRALRLEDRRMSNIDELVTQWGVLLKNFSQFNKYSPPISLLLLLAFLSVGCAALEEAQRRKQERTRQQQQQRYVTFERPTTEIQMAEDGLDARERTLHLYFCRGPVDPSRL